MATFRYSAAIVLALLFLAEIEHVVPKRDFVGPQPARFEWTAAKDVDEYVMTVENEVDVLLFEARTHDTFLDWPKGNTLDPGTYFWRVIGTSGGRPVADSGRAAFVISE